MSIPYLYSYRRCPYAMRARMALVSAGIQCDVEEISFKNKPEKMLAISPKGTVPVLVISEDNFLEESLDIVYWALEQNDPDGLLDCDMAAVENLITENDGDFKGALDRFKYPSRFPDEDCSGSKEMAVVFLEKLNQRLSTSKNLMGENVSVADICIFPFVRQFSSVDRPWFDSLDMEPLQKWLEGHVKSDLFKKVFKKQDEAVYKLL